MRLAVATLFVAVSLFAACRDNPPFIMADGFLLPYPQWSSPCASDAGRE